MRLNHLIVMAVAVLVVAGMALYPDAVTAAALEGLTLFALKALPSLLPFIVGTQLLLRSGALGLLSVPLRPVMRMLRLPDSAGAAVLGSLVSGYPTGAHITADLADKKHLSAEQTLRLASLASHPGPLFALGTVAGLLGPGGGVAAIAMLVACAAGALAAGLVQPVPKGNAVAEPSFSPAPLSKMLPEALRDGCVAMLPVAGAVCFSSVLGAMIDACGLGLSIERILSATLGPALAHAAPKTVMELVNGTAAAASAAAPLRARATLCCFALAWGGVSVQLQALSYLSPHIKGASKLVFGKAVQACVATLVFHLLWPLLPVPATVFAQINPAAAIAVPWLLLPVCAWAASRIAEKSPDQRRSRSVRAPS